MQNKKKRSRASRLRRAETLHVLKWLALCFPHGLSLMWSRNCRWNPVLKWLVSGVYAALALAILLYPAPSSSKTGGINIVGIEHSAEVYGPELPAMVQDASTYQYNVTDSILTDSSNQEEIEYVYAAENAANYHRFTCKFAYASSERLTPYQATFLGYTPCKLCKPPVYSQFGDTEDAADTTEGE